MPLSGFQALEMLEEKVYDAVVDNMVKQSKDNSFPFDSQIMSFTEYCKNVYGLTAFLRVTLT